MPKTPKIEPFLLVIVDDDRHTFSVVGPMMDDTGYIDRVSAAQAKGREVLCHSPGRSQTREQIIDYFQKSGLKYDADLGI
jgi:hypothetical protein